jgi:membrane fusion protein, multidrug efflux system
MYMERQGHGGSAGFTIVSESSPRHGQTASAVEAPDGRLPPPDPDPAVRGPNPQEPPQPVTTRLPALRAPESEMAGQGAKSRRLNLRRLAIVAAALLALGAGGTFGYRWWTVGRFMVTTDDAYVRAHNTTLAAKVSGYVASIPIEDNAYIHAGDVIATIDDGDYRLAVDAARDKVATQQTTVERIGRQVGAQQAAVEQAKAQVASAQAASKRMQLELDRQQSLAEKSYASRQALEQAQANRDQGVASVDSAAAALDAAQANVDVLKAQQQEAARTLDELRTALAKAERDLSFTVIRAPIDGVFGNRAVQTGDFMQTGQRLASLVPLDEVYIEANFKETQLARLREGQTVAISVDALPDERIEGAVESLSPASGAVFSLLPPDNATGNFTKIVQRLPVRIRVPLDVAWRRLLRPGMSVVVSVDTKSAPSLASLRRASR